MVTELDETIRQIRTSIFQLRGPLTAETGTVRSAVLSVVSELEPVLGLQPRVTFAGPVDLAVPDSSVDDLVAVVREALTNVARHAYASWVDVAVEATADELVLEVTDDGVGIRARLALERAGQPPRPGRTPRRHVHGWPDRRAGRGHTTTRNPPAMDDSAPMNDAADRAIRVFLLDDHEVVRRGIADVLEADGIAVVGEAATAAEALRRIPAASPDVAILDARLPDGSGIDVCREVRSTMPAVRCLILTSYDDADAVFAAVMGGASGYLLKQIRGTSLVDAVRQVAAGRSLLDPAVTERLLTRLREGTTTDPRLASLTDREREILGLIADGLTNRQIGDRLFLAEKTVKNYVSGLLAKLGMQRRTQAAVYGATIRDG